MLLQNPDIINKIKQSLIYNEIEDQVIARETDFCKEEYSYDQKKNQLLISTFKQKCRGQNEKIKHVKFYRSSSGRGGFVLQKVQLEEDRKKQITLWEASYVD